MKLFIASLLLLSLTTSANTVETIYNANSELHPLLKTEIATVLSEKFSCINSYGLKEIATEVVVDEVDQGVVDYYYTTTFSASYTYDYHPNKAVITVRSAKYAGSNPTIKWTDIESIEGQISCD